MNKSAFALIMIFICLRFYGNEKAVIEALSYMDMKTSDICIESESFKRDSFSFYLPDYLLNHPEKSEFVSEELMSIVKEYSINKIIGYSCTGKYDKKKDKNGNSAVITANPNTFSIAFLISDSISDSAYYHSAEEYLQIVKRNPINSGIMKEMSAKLEYILKLNEDELKKYFSSGKHGIPDSLLIVDYEGNDTHRIENPNTLIIDFEGDDVYIADGDFTLGCGNGGLGGVIDISGNDKYQGGNFSIGCGVNGIGFIDDRSGNDEYVSLMASIGSGFNGAGILIDRDGNDKYRSTGYSQGFGFTQGIGIIYDISGNDDYIVSGGVEDNREKGYHSHLSQGFGFGIRDIASGGIGILFDDDGDDFYCGEYFVQGSSYWYSLGILYDNKGNDTYRSRRYSQGAGTHFTTGILMDREGDDAYISWGVSQGCGHDFASGLLFDYDGADTYISDWLSQGAGNANGCGILIDFNGDDNYICKKNDSQGWGNEDRGTYSVGVLYDKNGDDSFNGEKTDTHVKTRMGVLIDEN